jgi:hypothetical protein
LQRSYWRELRNPPDTFLLDKFALLSVWLAGLLVVVCWPALVFGAILRVVGEVNLERIQVGLLGYAMPQLAVAVYLEGLYAFWKPRRRYMNVCG